MPIDDKSSLGLQLLYEKWVVKESWLLEEEAIPLLLGLKPGSETTIEAFSDLRTRIYRAIENKELKVIQQTSKADSEFTVTPAEIYRWAMLNQVELYPEFANLMNFVLKTVLVADIAVQAEESPVSRYINNDIERILGACLAVVCRYPEKCKGRQGNFKVEKILKLVNEHAEDLFGKKTPAISSVIVRDAVNQWLLKLG